MIHLIVLTLLLLVNLNEMVPNGLPDWHLIGRSLSFLLAYLTIEMLHYKNMKPLTIH